MHGCSLVCVGVSIEGRKSAFVRTDGAVGECRSRVDKGLRAQSQGDECGLGRTTVRTDGGGGVVSLAWAECCAGGRGLERGAPPKKYAFRGSNSICPGNHNPAIWRLILRFADARIRGMLRRHGPRAVLGPLTCRERGRAQAIGDGNGSHGGPTCVRILPRHHAATRTFAKIQPLHYEIIESRAVVGLPHLLSQPYVNRDFSEGGDILWIPNPIYDKALIRQYLHRWGVKF